MVEDTIMAGTKDGGALAAQTNKNKYGEDYYHRIGKLGGVKGTTGGFADGEEGRERARKFGKIGGQNSKRIARRNI